MTTTDPGTRRSVDLDISGMTCASCAARIEKKLNKVDGVAASVNYATAKANLLVAPGISPDELITVVQQAGYDASLPTPESTPPDHAAELRPRLIVAMALAIPVIVLAMVPAWQFPGWQWVSLALTTPIVTWCAWPFHRSAVVNARHGATTMDTLISLGATAAYLWSVGALLFGNAGHIGYHHGFSVMLMRGDASSNLYFEAAAAVVSFLLLGRYLEARARREAGSALQALLHLGAKTVTMLRTGLDGQLTETEMPISALHVGDTFVVRPGSTIATDGQVLSGHSAVDNHMITGESVPVEVGPGDAVIGACLNTSGRLVVEATAVGSDTQLASIARLIEQAQVGKASVQRLADKISGVFVPVVLALSALTFAGWMIAGGGWGSAFSSAVAVLIIACPCALGLATPTALLAGTGRGAELGIVIRGPEALERAQGVDTVVLDKTGTITTGQMSVTDQVPAAGVSAEQLLSVAAGVESGSDHPISAAISAAAAGTPRFEVSGHTVVPGRGITAGHEDDLVLVGTAALLADHHVSIPDEISAAADRLRSQGRTLVFVAPVALADPLGQHAQVLGLLGIGDTAPDSSAAAVAEFERLGLHPVMLTGDHAAAAQHIASQVGITDIRADVLPSDKLAVITELQANGHRVAMVGDGINDAAALTASHLGIAMGGGTDVAIAASDLTLMRPDLRLAADAIRLSRATLRTIKQNLFWAFFYNVLALPIAALGFLNPMFAGMAMAFSSVFVVTNSLRLRRFQPR